MTSASTRVPTRRILVFALLVVIGGLLDLGTKSWIFGHMGYDPPDRSRVIWVIPHVLSLETHLNEGALFGMGQGRGGLFSILSICAVLGIIYWLFYAGAAHDRLLLAALGMITGGVIGNLYDRLGLPGLIWNHSEPDLHLAGQPVYAVRDWIHFEIPGWLDWPIFNIADSLLVCGAGLLIWHAFRGEAAADGGKKPEQNVSPAPLK
jgi:signal peptidase II